MLKGTSNRCFAPELLASVTEVGLGTSQIAAIPKAQRDFPLPVPAMI